MDPGPGLNLRHQQLPVYLPLLTSPVPVTTCLAHPPLYEQLVLSVLDLHLHPHCVIPHDPNFLRKNSRHLKLEVPDRTNNNCSIWMFGRNTEVNHS
jgi:hypothetical protein